MEPTLGAGHFTILHFRASIDPDTTFLIKSAMLLIIFKGNSPNEWLFMFIFSRNLQKIGTFWKHGKTGLFQQPQKPCNIGEIYVIQMSNMDCFMLNGLFRYHTCLGSGFGSSIFPWN